MLVKIYQPLHAARGAGPWCALGTFTSLEEAEKVDLKGKGINGEDGFIQIYNAVKVGEEYYFLQDQYALNPKPIKNVK